MMIHHNKQDAYYLFSKIIQTHFSRIPWAQKLMRGIVFVASSLIYV